MIGLEFANELAVHILETMTFVHNDVLPLISGEEFTIPYDNLIRGYDDRERAIEFLELVVSLVFALIRSTVVQFNRDSRDESMKCMSGNCKQFGSWTV